MASSGNFNTYSPINVQGPAGPGTYSGSEGLTGGDTTQVQTSWVGTHFAFPSGKWYFEVRKPASPVGGWPRIGFYGMGGGGDSLASITTETSNNLSSLRLNQGDDTMNKYVFGSTSSSSVAGSISSGDILQVAIDVDAGKIWYGVNDTYLVSGDPAGGSNAIDDYAEGTYNPVQVCVGTYNNPDLPDINFGQDSTFRGQRTAGGNADGNGFGDFAYSPPTGFLAMCSANVPISDNIDPAQTDDDFPAKQFNAITWTGNRTSNSTVNNITGVGFQPDLVWLKFTEQTYDWRLVDSSRGVTEAIRSNQTTVEQTEANGLYQFGSDGFSVKGDNNYNYNGGLFIGYCWKANGGTTASNSDGDITSTVQANTDAGFSIVTYTGDGTDHRGVGYGSANIGHGLDSAPELVITKRRDSSGSWYTLHASAGVGYLTLNSSGAFQSGAVPFGPALPTTTTFGGYSANNNSSHTYVCYCWHSVEGYSKFGSFEGNANNDGSFIYTGFRPRLLFIKNMDSSSAWGIYDGKRPGFNDCDLGAWDETTAFPGNVGTYPCDILSNGFKLRTSNSTVNSSHTWVYGAWGDVPFKYNNTF